MEKIKVTFLCDELAQESLKEMHHNGCECEIKVQGKIAQIDCAGKQTSVMVVGECLYIAERKDGRIWLERE